MATKIRSRTQVSKVTGRAGTRISRPNKTISIINRVVINKRAATTRAAYNANFSLPIA